MLVASFHLQGMLVFPKSQCGKKSTKNIPRDNTTFIFFFFICSRNPNSAPTPSPAPSNFSSIGIGFDDEAVAIEYDSTSIYVAGIFMKTNDGSSNVTSVVKITGSVYENLGSGPTSGNVFSLRLINQRLFAVGTFTMLCGFNVSYVAYWNSNRWNSFNSTSITMNVNTLYYDSELSRYYFGTSNSFFFVSGIVVTAIATVTSGNDVNVIVKDSSSGHFYIGGGIDIFLNVFFLR